MAGESKKSVSGAIKATRTGPAEADGRQEDLRVRVIQLGVRSVLPRSGGKGFAGAPI